ncbi:MAG: class I SAM-dependent methyltransferase [Acidimicrobiia bacterium]|nr:class I SAM-dependent methyltransferase [Acidimicrobiia bacterium]
MAEAGDYFEAIYQRAGRETSSIPWASLAPSPIVENWLTSAGGPPGAAVVVASGLGDDAEALADRGWYVTGFDVSPTAIEWARERFPDSSVDYAVADLFDLPANWSQAFALVVEVFTIQSLDPKWRLRAIRSIADLVAPGGTLLVAAIGGDTVPTVDGPPWPVARHQLDDFVTAGLTEVEFGHRSSPWQGLDHLEAEYRRPIRP